MSFNCLQTIPVTLVLEKLSFTKPISGAKNVGDFKSCPGMGWQGCGGVLEPTSRYLVMTVCTQRGDDLFTNDWEHRLLLYSETKPPLTFLFNCY